MNNNFAKVISVFLHPLMMPTFLFSVLFYFAPVSVRPLSDNNFLRVLIIINLLTFIIPLIGVMVLRLAYVINSIKVWKLKFSRNISYDEAAMVLSTENNGGEKPYPDFLMEERKERILPFLFTTIYYAVSTYMFVEIWKQFNMIFGIIMAGMTLVILVVTIITFFWKISIHSAAIAGVLGFLIATGLKYPDNQLFFPIIVVLVLAGFTMSARLQLNAHKLHQVSTGALVGFVICFSLLYIFI